MSGIFWKEIYSKFQCGSIITTFFYLWWPDFMPLNSNVDLLLRHSNPQFHIVQTSLNSNVDLLLRFTRSDRIYLRCDSKFQCGSIITLLSMLFDFSLYHSKFQCGSIITIFYHLLSMSQFSLNSNVDLLLPAKSPGERIWIGSKFQCGSIITIPLSFDCI